MTAQDRTVATSDEDVQILVEVNGEAWIRVGNFKSSWPADKHYILEVEGNGSGEVSSGSH